MANSYLWKKAKKIDRSLVGENWPDKLTLRQIAKLRFPECDEKPLLDDMYDKAESGNLEFNDVKIAFYNYQRSSASVSKSRNDGLEFLRESYKDRLISSHTPICGWNEVLKGAKRGDPIKLKQHPGGCNCVCTIEEVYPNGFPKRCKVEGVHNHGEKIEESLSVEPLLTAKQCHEYLKSVKQDASADSILYGWWGDLESTNAEGNGTGSQETTESGSIKTNRPSRNDFDWSGLLVIPKNAGNWVYAIDDMTRCFHKLNNRLPNKAEAWGQLCTNPPENYSITLGKDKRLYMPSADPLSKRAFDARWNRYTNKT